ncbi:glycoside hydrolase family 78 protein [Cadophora sp. DSE1049]|nr:glycoside hydrolase family 78 protein [Cadophora sp. DSE1049]
MDSEWDARASWIWHPKYDDTRNPGSIVLFRREFDLQKLPSSLTIAITADTRYRLFLNGQSVSVGPCKGTPHYWHYETVDVTAFARQGANVLAAQVLRYSPAHRGNTPVTRSRKPGFILLAKGEEFELSTDLQWRCVEDQSVSFCGDSDMDLFLAVDETVDGPSRQFGWIEQGFDDSAWLAPMEITNEFPGIEVSELPWSIFPRSIPPLTEIPKLYKGVVAVIKSAEGVSVDEISKQWTALLRNRQPVVVPAHQEIEIDIQAQEYSTAYLQFAFRNGAHAIFKHLSAESYEETPRKTGLDKIQKGNRLDFQNGYLNGVWNKYVVAGRSSEHYETFWFRAFRFVRLSIKTASEPLIVTDISYRETNYPLEVRATFTTPSSPMLSSFWDISLRTLKNCMHETYEDCPYYEQTQYTFDSRLQMLLTYAVSGDDRLPRKAIHDFHASSRPDGLLSFRCPSHTNIVLPVFSLFFPLMIHDHMMYLGNKDLAKRFFPTIDAILNYFDRQIGPLGLVSRFSLRLWSFTDWIDDWKMGTPHAAREGPGTYNSLVYALSLGIAADVALFIGQPDRADDYYRRKSAVIKAVNTHCFDGTWYYDGPISDKPSPPPRWLSQHSQIYAILSGAIEGSAAQALMRRTLRDQTLYKATLSQAFYLLRALERTSLYELAPDIWKPWATMITQGLDTWAETLDNPRSDCHAWSAAPLYELSSMILGVQPAAPGFEVAYVRPALNLLDRADGSVATPHGLLRVCWKAVTGTDQESTQPCRVYLCVEAPAGILVKLSVPSAINANVITFKGRYEDTIELK